MGAAPGVSVVICTHNGAPRLLATLGHLAAQTAPASLAWEVIVVDNASTDETAAVASGAWPAHAPAPLRIVAEPQLGLGHARARGLAEARYEVVSFVDDDNWVAPDWIATAWDVMATRPAVAAVGGDAEAVPERTPPAWFARYPDIWAVGRQGDVAGEDVGHLRGAGLCVRRAAWEQITGAGFVPVLVGRQGRGMNAGEDTEICVALRLAGWRLRYDPRLSLGHFIPTERLVWGYARRVSEGWGHGTAWLDHYQLAAQTEGRSGRLGEFWTLRLVHTGWRLIAVCLLALLRPGDGSHVVLRREVLRGRLRGLLEQRRTWRANVRRVRQAAWRRAGL